MYRRREKSVYRESISNGNKFSSLSGAVTLLHFISYSSVGMKNGRNKYLHYIRFPLLWLEYLKIHPIFLKSILITTSIFSPQQSPAALLTPRWVATPPCTPTLLRFFGFHNSGLCSLIILVNEARWNVVYKHTKHHKRMNLLRWVLFPLWHRNSRQICNQQFINTDTKSAPLNKFFVL